MMPKFSTFLYSSLLMGLVYGAPTHAQIIYPSTPTGETERGVIGDYVYQLRQTVFPDATNGRVGIMTNSPEAMLSIANQVKFSGAGDATQDADMLFDTSGKIAAEANLYLTSSSNAALGYGDIIFASQAEDDASATEIMRVTRDGKVGIGTNAPAQKLDIQGHSIRIGADFADEDLRSAGAPKLSIISAAGANAGDKDFAKISSIRTGSVNSLLVGGGMSDKRAATVMSFYTAENANTDFGTERLRIDSVGNVSIGTASPSSGDQALKLDVEGAIGGTHFCDEDGNNCTTPATLASVASGSGGKFVDGTDANNAVYTTGNVGIGTTSPNTLLQVGDPSLTSTVISSVESSGNSLLLARTLDSEGEASLFLNSSNNSLSLRSFSDSANSGSFAGINLAGWNRLATSTTSNGIILSTVSNSPVVIATNSVERIRIDGNGNVGIGTTNPLGKLDIANGAYNEVYFSGTDNTNITSQGDISLTSTKTNGYVRIDADGGNTNDFIVRTGNVGMGTIVPTEKLTVDGNILVSDTNDICIDDDGTAGLSGSDTCLSSAATGSGGKFVDGTDANDAVYTTGNVGIGTSDPNVRLDVDLDIHANSDGVASRGLLVGPTGFAGALVYLASGDLELSPRSGYDLVFSNSLAGTELMRIENNGNVGIGTNTPTEKLEVFGQAAGDGILITHDHASAGKWMLNSGFGGVGHPGFFISDDGEARLSIGSTGNVGIGTGSPAQKLQIGDSTTTGTIITSVESSENAELRARTYGDSNVASMKLLSPGGGANFAAYGPTSTASIGSQNLAGWFNISTSNISDGLAIRNNKSGAPIAFFNGSTESMRIAGDGNIGIGTNTPSTGGEQDLKLDVEGAIGATHFCDEDGNNCTTASALASGSGGKFVDGTDANDAVYTTGNVGIGTNEPNTLFHIRRSAGAIATDFITVDGTGNSGIGRGLSILFKTPGGATGSIEGARIKAVQSGNSNRGTDISFETGLNSVNSTTEKMRITKDGNVGIGTTSPSARLEIQAENISETLLELNKVAGHTGDILNVKNSIDNDAFKIDAAGRIFLGTYGSESAPSLTFLGDQDTGVFNASGANALGFATFGTEKMRINGIGNVGIGTTSPTEKLHISGVDPTFYLDNNGGSQARVLFDSNINFRVTDGNQDFFTINNAGSGNDVLLRVRDDTDSDLAVFTASGTELFRVTNSGNVSIGTSNPAEKLEVAGAVKISETVSGCGPATTGTIQYIGSVFQGCTDDLDKNGTVGDYGWVDLH